ncbi:MAG: PAS domain S-box protein, partial [Fibrobacteria bacterium]
MTATVGSRPDVADKAFTDLAALAARICGAPAATIQVHDNGFAHLLAAFGQVTDDAYPYRTEIPFEDAEGRLLGRLTLLNRAAMELSVDQAHILAGLAAQASALLRLSGGHFRPQASLEAQFLDILELVPDAVFMHAKGRFTWANSAALKLSAAGSLSDLIGKPIANVFAPETREAVEGRLEDVYQNRLATARRLLRYLRHDAQKIPVEVASIAIQLGGEECRLVLARNISSRVEAAENLRESEERFHVFSDIFRNIQAGLFVWQMECPAEQPRFRLLAINAAAANMTGRSIEDVIGRTMKEGFPDAYDRGLTAKCQRVIATGESMDLGEIICGPKRDVIVTAKIIPLPNDTVAVAFENVTEERRNREVLRQSVERFELIAQATNDAVWEYKPLSGDTWWNERAFQLFGYDSDRMAPSMDAWKKRLHPDDCERVELAFKQVSEGGADTWVREYRINRKDGTTGHIYERGYVVRGDGGAPVRILGAMLDITELKRAEAAVRESEEKYRKLVEVLPDVIVIGIEDKLAFINRAGLEFYGVKNEAEILGKPAVEFFHPDSRLAVGMRLAQLDQGVEIPPMEHRILRKDGSIIEAEARSISFPYQGRMAKLAVIRDITERKQAEFALRDSEERYRQLFLNNPQPMWLYDPATLRFLDVNQAAIDKYGFSRAEFLARTMKDLWLEEDFPELAEATRQLIEAKESREVRRHRRKDGSIIHAEVFHHYIELSGNGAAIALANDITEKLETLERLRHSEERYRTLAAVSPVGLYRTDPRGRCTYVNDHLCGILGLSQEQALGTSVTFLVHPADSAWVKEAWHNAAVRGLPFHAEYRMRRSDNRTVWVMGNALADKAPDGAVIGFIGTISDITERKQAEILLACQKRTLAMVASDRDVEDVLVSLARYVEKESMGGKGCVLQLDAETRRLRWLAAPGIAPSFKEASPSFPIDGESGALGRSALAKEYAFSPDVAADPEWRGGAEAASAGYQSCASHPIRGSFGQVLGVF